MFVRTCALLASYSIIVSTHAQSTLRSQFVAGGFIRPLWVTAPPGDQARLFVVEQRNDATPPVGFVRIIDRSNNQVLQDPFWTSPALANGNSEGVLCLVFHPDFPNVCYVSYTQLEDRRTVISQLLVDPLNPNRVLQGSERIILRLWAPSNKHNGGWMAFSRLGGTYLHIALGDDANPIVAQDVTDELRGKVLRIDIDGPDNIPGTPDDDAFPNDPERNYSIPPDNPYVGFDGDDEIIAYGLRSPWRPHLDPFSGRLYIADAGEVDREELSVVDFKQWPANLGWVCTEGTLVTNDPRCFPGAQPITIPSLEYTNINSTLATIPPTNIRGCAIVGGPTLPASFGRCLQGQQLFADYCTADIFTARYDSAGRLVSVENRTQELHPGGARTISWISSFGHTQIEHNQNALQAIFVCDSVDGEVFEILPATIDPACPRWCDDIDINNDGAPFDPVDIDAFLSIFSEGPCIPQAATCNDIDFNNDGATFDPADIDSFLSAYSEGPCL